MEITIAFSQLVIMIYILFYEYKRKSPALFLWSMLLIIFGIPHFFTVTNILKSIYPAHVLFVASLFSLIFCLLYLCVRFLSKSKPSYRNVLENSDNIFPIAKVLTVILILNFALQVYTTYSHTGNLLESSWGTRRAISKGNSYLSMDGILSYIRYALSSVLLIYIILKKRNYAIFILIILFLAALLSRQRVALLPIFVCLLSYFIICNKKLKFTTFFALSFVAILGIYFIFALQMFRYGGSISNFFINFEWSNFNNAIISRITEGEGEFGLREAFYFFIENNNNFENFDRGHTYIRLFMFFLPTQWSLGLKPPDFAISMGNAWNPLTEGYSMHPTLLGDCFANFNFLGCLIGGLFWGVIANFVDLILKKIPFETVIPVFITCGCCFILIGRGSVYNASVCMIYSIIFILLISYFLNKNAIVKKE